MTETSDITENTIIDAKAVYWLSFASISFYRKIWCFEYIC